MSARRRRGALPLLVLAAAACHGGSAVDEIPAPSLEGVELEVVESLNAAREALRREPDSSKAWGRLGDHYFVHDFTAPAAACYARAAELDPESFLWPYRRGLALMKDRPEEALAPLERCLVSLENYAPALRAYAQVLVRLARSDEAIEPFTRASALDPSDPEAETALGMIELARRDFEAARAHLEAAVARDERYVQAHVALSQVYLALGQEKKAQRHAELSQTLRPQNPERDPYASPNVPPAGARARTRYGRQLEEQGSPAEAAEQYRLAVRSNPDYYLARRSLASLLVADGRRDEALALLREYEALNPSFERVRRDLAKLQASGGGLDPAELEDEGD